MSISPTTFPIKGIHCNGCAHLIEETLKEQPGVSFAAVNRAANTVTVAFDAQASTPKALARVLAAAGYELVVE